MVGGREEGTVSDDLCPEDCNYTPSIRCPIPWAFCSLPNVTLQSAGMMAKAAVRINSGIAQWTILDRHRQMQALLDGSDEGITTESCETRCDKLRLVLSPLMTSANSGVDGNAFVTLMSLRNRLFSVWIYECVRVCVRVSVCMGMNRDMREWRDTTYKLEQERVTWLMMQENKWVNERTRQTQTFNYHWSKRWMTMKWLRTALE